MSRRARSRALPTLLPRRCTETTRRAPIWLRGTQVACVAERADETLLLRRESSRVGVRVPGARLARYRCCRAWRAIAARQTSLATCCSWNRLELSRSAGLACGSPRGSSKTALAAERASAFVCLSL
eukprot:972131-Prymnesium_polylepis.1